jgi:monoamine oxidase
MPVDPEDLMKRRDVIKVGGAAITGLSLSAGTRSNKNLIVMGAGIAGLACAYELKRRGHDVTVLEASGRAGGHVRTLHDPFADGLYADAGAEHFYYPGYTEYWRYLKEFSLTAIPYPRRDNMIRFLNGGRYSEDDLRSRTVLGKPDRGFRAPPRDPNLSCLFRRLLAGPSSPPSSP